jgi:hypothetical protein
MVHSIRDIGKRISSMAKDKRPGLTQLNMKVITRLERNMG